MKKIHLVFTTAACLVAAAGVFAKVSTVDTITYYRSSVESQTGAHCDVTISTPSCVTGTQCARKFTVAGESKLFYLSTITTPTGGQPGACTILPGDVQQ